MLLNLAPGKAVNTDTVTHVAAITCGVWRKRYRVVLQFVGGHVVFGEFHSHEEAVERAEELIAVVNGSNAMDRREAVCCSN